MKKKILAVVLSIAMLGSFTACANSKNAKKTDVEDDTPSYITTPSELSQNDYRGATMRTLCLRQKILDTVDQMKSQNAIIRQNNPNLYWNTDGYQDFVTDFMTESIITDMQFFNEEECGWDAILWSMEAQEDSSFTTKTSTNKGALSTSSEEAIHFKDGLSINKNAKDDYTVSGMEVSLEGISLLKTVNGTKAETVQYSGTGEYRALYDCDKDWAKSYCTITFENEQLPSITPYFFEYMRLDADRYLIQTNRERLYVVLQPTEQDISIIDRPIKEFYYSKLLKDGARSTFSSFKPMDTYNPKTGQYNRDAIEYNELMQKYSLINDKGQIANCYGNYDSAMLRDDKKELDRSWVFEETSLEQVLVYKDDAFIATTFNKLSEKYDQFSYYTESTPAELKDELKGLVNVEALVGILSVPQTDMSVLEPVNPYNILTNEEMAEFGYRYDDDNNVVDETGKVICSVWDGKAYINAEEARKAMEKPKEERMRPKETESLDDNNDEETETETEENGENIEETLEGEAGNV